jgi:hypothetical protein
MKENGTSEAQKRPKLIAGLVIAFGLFHGASMLLGILPRGAGINEALAPYRQLTGTEQDWGMFHTIPTVREKLLTVEVADASGPVSEFGPILPGLKPYATHSRIRYYYLLNRMTAPGSSYFDPYIDQLREAVAKDSPGIPVEFMLKTETDYIRLIKRIQEDGKMTLRKSGAHGPFPISQ